MIIKNCKNTLQSSTNSLKTSSTPKDIYPIPNYNTYTQISIIIHIPKYKIYPIIPQGLIKNMKSWDWIYLKWNFISPKSSWLLQNTALHNKIVIMKSIKTYINYKIN